MFTLCHFRDPFFNISARATQSDATVKCFIDNTQLFHEKKTSTKLQNEKINVQSNRTACEEKESEREREVFCVSTL